MYLTIIMLDVLLTELLVHKVLLKNSCLVFPLATAFKLEYLILFPSGKALKSSLQCWFCLFVIKLMAIFLRHSRVKFLLHVPFYLRDVTAEISFRLCCQKISSPAWEPKLPSFQNISTHQGHFWHRVSVKNPEFLKCCSFSLDR